MRTAATTVNQYRDPITRESRTVILCDEHTSVMLRVLRAAGVGCGGTTAPSLADCDACANEEVK